LTFRLPTNGRPDTENGTPISCWDSLEQASRMRIFRFSQRCSRGFLFLDVTPDGVVILYRGVEISNSTLERTNTTSGRNFGTRRYIPPQSLRIVFYKFMPILLLINNLLKFCSRSLVLVYACAKSEVNLHVHNDKQAQNGRRIKTSQILDLTIPTTIARSLAMGKEWRPINVPVSI
jgi:hypothetical protein